jgi:hypothetical protein
VAHKYQETKDLFKIIWKSTILFIVISFLSTAIFSYLPFPWGDYQVNTKFSYLKDKQLDPNVYFLGSSITNRQIIPSVFDSVVNDPNLLSFNLASDGKMLPYPFQELEYLLAQDSTIKYVFLELDGFTYLNPKHIFTTNGIYNITPKWYTFSMTNLWFGSSIIIKNKIGMTGRYTYAIIANMLKIGMRKDIIKAHLETNKWDYEILERSGMGHLTFDSLFTADKFQIENKTAIINETKSEYQQAIKKLHLGLKLDENKVQNYLLKWYVKYAQSHGTQLVYVINPRKSVLMSIEQSINIKSILPAKNVIEIADPDKYPELYNEDYRWDSGHLNIKGAQLFS